jgi:hypothetical protein
MTTSKMLTQEQIDAGLRETRAAIDRARKALDRSRANQDKTGITPEKLQQCFNRMSPRARTWINSMVQVGVTRNTDSKPAGVKAAPRKMRSMV